MRPGPSKNLLTSNLAGVRTQLANNAGLGSMHIGRGQILRTWMVPALSRSGTSFIELSHFWIGLQSILLRK